MEVHPARAAFERGQVRHCAFLVPPRSAAAQVESLEPDRIAGHERAQDQAPGRVLVGVVVGHAVVAPARAVEHADRILHPLIEEFARELDPEVPSSRGPIDRRAFGEFPEEQRLNLLHRERLFELADLERGLRKVVPGEVAVLEFGFAADEIPLDLHLPVLVKPRLGVDARGTVEEAAGIALVAGEESPVLLEPAADAQDELFVGRAQVEPVFEVYLGAGGALRQRFCGRNPVGGRGLCAGRRHERGRLLLLQRVDPGGLRLDEGLELLEFLLHGFRGVRLLLADCGEAREAREQDQGKEATEERRHDTLPPTGPPPRPDSLLLISLSAHASTQ